MISIERGTVHVCGVIAYTCLVASAQPALGQLNLGPEQLVQASSVDIDVPGYSVPRFMHWNNDGLRDLIVGEGSGSFAGMVRVYLNEGTASDPRFSTRFYAQSEGSNLVLPGFS